LFARRIDFFWASFLNCLAILENFVGTREQLSSALAFGPFGKTAITWNRFRADYVILSSFGFLVSEQRRLFKVSGHLGERLANGSDVIAITDSHSLEGSREFLTLLDSIALLLRWDGMRNPAKMPHCHAKRLSQVMVSCRRRNLCLGSHSLNGRGRFFRHGHEKLFVNKPLTPVLDEYFS
jgi:hypothetical protein